MDVFFQLFLVYSLITAIPNFIVNWLLIGKEISLELTQLFFNRKAPSDDDRLQLGLIDIEYLFIHWLNPAWLFREEYENVAGYDPLDIVIENKNDEEHYYA